MTAEGFLTDRTGGVRVSGSYRGSRFERPASNRPARQSSKAIPSRSMPTFGQGLQLVRDPYSQASKGETIITAVMLVGDVVVLRGGAFVQDSFRVG